MLIYASRAGENVTAMDLIKACENRIAHIKQELQKDDRMATRVDKLATKEGDIEIIVRWQKLGVKPTKKARALAKLSQLTQELGGYDKEFDAGAAASK